MLLKGLPQLKNTMKLSLPPCASSHQFLRGFGISSRVMSGHNKWSTIKHDKAKNDAERTKIFSKFANQIALAVKMGGSADPALNLRLASAIELANKNNVTKRVIENAIKKGSGVSDKGGAKAESCTYEGMGPGGVAFVVEALTDNKNRTIGLVRSTFTKANGSMTPTLYFFERRGFVVAQPPAHLKDIEQVFEAVLDIDGVHDLSVLPAEKETTQAAQSASQTEEIISEIYEVSTEPGTANQTAALLKDRGFSIKEIGVDYIHKNDMATQIEDPDVQIKLDRFMQQLDEIEDVTAVYNNAR
ncbi:LAMI_0H13520g1_1 [Lachancea mirantina]|uniref:LAMI_0H13520g1_1 n=1 Tax=Lachancea mirantina TaxID=1230905 RepID=A0A1G4KHY4_9SACH|nr:LAMI_0H13520g1_1 [Lachancea mirantina]